ncbi:acyl-CoA N-acyltransferase [Daldinia vernicosa]|uniref:acyl-CoA N-acyltransferase n=1 Tax=Daldinia vernicosa TaxID=114800 RepID=UPI002007F736|nr:acyl-CoA N-acyltransferase [Daldinia vernicosa]KAI0851887.1 acyl-CoA N-acyltransferase [Daldinia vernicosa]
MTTWKIERCTVADAAALARNNMSAFWEDPNWKLIWSKETTLDMLIENNAKRYPRILATDREKKRHEKAVDPATGELVGYARWVLPSEHLAAEDGSPEWAEAQVPDVSDEEKARFEELAKSARLATRKEADGMDDRNDEVLARLLAAGTYIKFEYLAVHPANKGKGIGSALVESGIRHAEKIGVPLFTMAYKAGRGIYERLGFKEVERVVQDATKYGGTGEYGAYFMVYDVPKKAPMSKSQGLGNPREECNDLGGNNGE